VEQAVMAGEQADDILKNIQKKQRKFGNKMEKNYSNGE